jgi:hypothetical protein
MPRRVDERSVGVLCDGLIASARRAQLAHRHVTARSPPRSVRAAAGFVRAECVRPLSADDLALEIAHDEGEHEAAVVDPRRALAIRER